MLLGEAILFASPKEGQNKIGGIEKPVQTRWVDALHKGRDRTIEKEPVQRGIIGVDTNLEILQEGKNLSDFWRKAQKLGMHRKQNPRTFSQKDDGNRTMGDRKTQGHAKPLEKPKMGGRRGFQEDDNILATGHRHTRPIL
jgi:hypothetical protein